MRIAALLLAALMACSAAAQPKIDGTWWKQSDEGQRLIYIAGYLQGMEVGGLVMPGAVCQALKRPAKECTDVGWTAYKSASQQYHGISAVQFRDGMNAFYADFRNQQIAFIGAMNYVAHSISGMPAAELDRLAEHMRRNAK